jgi:WD40 repeat protein/flagellar basal body-associated protein FliL
MSTLPVFPESAIEANPFPGLRSFDVWENHLFFGRDAQVDALLGKLSDNRFVCVVGTSGSGKSSLVRAGLLPVLFGGFLSGAGSSWRVAIFRPGNDPIHNLASALNASDVFGAGDPDEDLMRTAITEATLESSALGLVQVVRQSRMESDENLLIVVDQFEELFRFKENSRLPGAADQAAAFVKLLLEGVRQPELPIYIVLTVRSDFLGECAQYRDLPRAINDGHYLIPRMQRDELREAIVGPVAVGGGKIAPRLVQQLLNDVGDNPDQLPILQHALMRAWTYWKVDHEEGEPIDLRHYEQIGGMARALSLHADEAYAELLDEQSRQVAEVVFKTLTERGLDNRGIRRPTRLKTVAAIAGATTEEVIAVIEIFRQPGRSFIMPPHGVSLGPESTLDISHESLMRTWTRLGRWVDEDAESAHLYRRLAESATLYEEGLAGLWRDPELAVAVEWRKREQPNEGWAQLYDPRYASAMAFLDASIARSQEEKGEKRRRKVMLRSAIVLFLLSAGLLAAWALKERASATDSETRALGQRAIAQQKSEEATREKERAQKSYLVAEAQRGTAEQQRGEAERQKKIALQQQQSAEQQRGEALAQRQRAEMAGREALSALDVAEGERRRAESERELAEKARADVETAGRNIARLRLLSIARGLAVKSIQIQKNEPEDLVALLALQSFHINADNGGNPRDPDVYAALNGAAKLIATARPTVLRSHSDGVRDVSCSPVGARIVTVGSDGRVLLWNRANLSAGAAQLANHPFTVRSVAFSGDGRSLAYGGDDGMVRLLTAATPTSGVQEIATGSSVVLSVGFAGGTRLTALGVDGKLRLLRPRADGFDILSAPVPLSSMATSAGAATVAAGTGDGRVFIWTIGGSDPPRIIATGAGPIQSLALSNDGRYLAVGTRGGSVRLRDLSTPESRPVLFSGHRSAVNALDFSHDGRLLASGGADGTVRLWNIARADDPPIVLHEHGSWVWGLAFSPDGATILSSSYDRTTHVNATGSETLAAEVSASLKRNLTRTEWTQFIGADVPYQRTVSRLPEGQ